MASNNNLEPRRDLPLHKIPELLAKITGTFASSISSSTLENAGASVDRAEELFLHYSHRTSRIGVDGLLRFCADLRLAPDSAEFLLFCFLCRAKEMYFLSRDEFLRGWKSFGEPMEHLDELRRNLIRFDVNSCREEFYLWTFHFGLNDGQRTLTTRNAIDLWKLFYSKDEAKPAILEPWLAYLEEDMIVDIPKLITCDTWKIFPQFAAFLQSNGFDSYDENDGWPSLFDGFVEDQREKQRQRTFRRQ